MPSHWRIAFWAAVIPHNLMEANINCALMWCHAVIVAMKSIMKLVWLFALSYLYLCCTEVVTTWESASMFRLHVMKRLCQVAALETNTAVMSEILKHLRKWSERGSHEGKFRLDAEHYTSPTLMNQVKRSYLTNQCVLRQLLFALAGLWFLS